MKNKNVGKLRELYGSIRHLFREDDARRSPSLLRKFISKINPIQEKDENGFYHYYIRFNKSQHVGTLIKVSKTLAYRVVKGAELSGDGRMLTGEHEVIKIKLR